ncbi:MAG: hypothetical protein JOS17DRAFT_735811, partial [Linnemannia elongata]
KKEKKIEKERKKGCVVVLGLFCLLFEQLCFHAPWYLLRLELSSPASQLTHTTDTPLLLTFFFLHSLSIFYNTRLCKCRSNPTFFLR